MNPAYTRRTRRLSYLAGLLGLVACTLALFPSLPLSGFWYVPLVVSLTFNTWSFVRSCRHMRHLRRSAARLRREVDALAVDVERYCRKVSQAANLGNILFNLLDEPNRHRLSVGLPLHITGSLGGQYLVKRGFVGNIVPLDERGRTKSYGLCVVVDAPGCCQHVRAHATRIAQVLLIQADEQRFLDTANRV